MPLKYLGKTPPKRPLNLDLDENENIVVRGEMRMFLENHYYTTGEMITISFDINKEIIEDAKALRILPKLKEEVKRQINQFIELRVGEDDGN